MKLTWYGHSCCSIEGGGVTILIDPFLTGNPLAAITAEEVQADYIILTHGHGDHYGDTTEIAGSFKPKQVEGEINATHS